VDLNTLIDVGIDVSSTAISLSYLPQITLIAKNINATNSTTNYPTTIPILLDPASITLANSMLVDSAPGAIGHLMNSPDLSQTTSYDWTTAHTALDHSQDISGTNNLAIMNGYFTSGYNPVISAYQDFTGIGGYNYQPLSSTGGYRWATFRWATNGIPTTLSFTMCGFTGDDQPILQQTKPYLTNILVFYRIEDPAVDSGTPANIAGPSGSEKYSTTWINALYSGGDEEEGKSFNNNYADLSNDLTFGGLPQGDSDFTFSDSNISINVLTPNVEDRSLYIYLTVGLPMDNSIAFTHAICNVT
jgi:hypothetical protein